MATQNPIESDGTYPLPEAQVDRFMMKVLVGYPTPPEEHAVVERALVPPGPPQVMLTPEDLIRMRKASRRSTSTPRSSSTPSGSSPPPDRREGRPRRPGEVRDLRGQPAGHDRARPGRPGARVPTQPGLRATQRRRRSSPRRVAPPHCAVARGHGRRPRRRHHPHPRPARGSDAGRGAAADL